MVLTIFECVHLENVYNLLAILYSLKDLSENLGFLRFNLVATEQIRYPLAVLKVDYGYCIQIYNNMWCMLYVIDKELEMKGLVYFIYIIKDLNRVDGGIKKTKGLALFFENINYENDFSFAMEKAFATK